MGLGVTGTYILGESLYSISVSWASGFQGPVTLKMIYKISVADFLIPKVIKKNYNLFYYQKREGEEGK